MKISLVIVYAIAMTIVVGGEIKIKGKVRKRFSAHRRHRAVQPPCNFNETIIEDEWSLMEAIGKSKYIFTGKVLSVKKVKSIDNGSRSNVYRLYLRRVLKGSMSDLRMFVKMEGSLETLSGSTVVVERPHARESCAPTPRPRLSAIFLSNGENVDTGRGPSPRLQLLTDPVPLTLYHLDRINAAVKDNGPKCVAISATSINLAMRRPLPALPYLRPRSQEALWSVEKVMAKCIRHDNTAPHTKFVPDSVIHRV